MCLWIFFYVNGWARRGGGGGGGGGGVVGYLSTPLHALQVSFATTSVASLPACVCFFSCLLVFFLGGGGRGGVRVPVPGLVGWEKTIESSRSFHYSQAFTHISKCENIDSDTDSVFTLDSAFKFSRNATKPELVWVFSQIHYLDSRTRFNWNCFREFSENIQRKARKVIFIEGG